MKKKKVFGTIALCTSVILSGCGSAIPDMTEEETHIISEYAANLLLKYDKNYEVKVADTTAYHEEEERKAKEARKAEEAAAKEAAKAALEEAQQEKNAAGGQSEDVQTVSTVEEFFGIDGIQIRYSGFQICDSYPEQSEDEDLFLALGATDGRKLFILNFDVNNTSGAELEVDMQALNPKFKVSVNGNTAQNSLFTFLPEDLAEYAGTLGADETVRTILAVEIPVEESESVESIVLSMKNAEKSAQLILQ